MRVKATGEFKRLGVHPKELGNIPEEGFEFEVSEERYEILKGKNDFQVVFVKAIEKEIETATKKLKTEKAVKKTTKKSK